MDDEDEGDMGKRLLIRGDASLSEGVAFTYARIMLNIWSFACKKANFDLSFLMFSSFWKNIALRGLMILMATFSISHQAMAKEGVTLLVFGDSLVAGYGLEQGVAFPDQLQEALDAEGRDVKIVNGGISGDTTAGGASRIAWSLADQPDAVMVVLGGNDALRGLSPDDMQANLEVIINAIGDKGMPMLIAGMHAPANMGGTYGKAFDQAFLNAVEKGKARGADLIFYPFFLDGVALEPRLNQNDGIHPNIEGVGVIVERIKPAVDDLLAMVK